MRIHNITKDDMLNGDGLRVVLWLAGCNHGCKGCQNPITHDPDGGAEFMINDLAEIYGELEKDWVSGLTISGGDGLYPKWRHTLELLCRFLKREFPDKTIWIYTGYDWEQVKHLPIMQYVDVLVDGKFVEELADVNYKWAGSTNQRVIDVKKSLEKGEIILWQ